MALVIKNWNASYTPDADGNYVNLTGRESGVIAWFLSYFKIDPTCEVQVNDDFIRFVTASLAGQEIRVIPLRSISSAYYGYEKPWKMALLITVLLSPLFFAGLVLGPLYYFLNKHLTVAVVETSGWVGSFSFKRSLIERQNISEQQAFQVIDIIRLQVEKKTV